MQETRQCAHIARPYRQLAFSVQMSHNDLPQQVFRWPKNPRNLSSTNWWSTLAIGFLVIRFVEHTFAEQSFLARLALILLIGMPIGLAVHAVLKFARRAWQRK
ncbi:hypothetical protein ACQKGL_27740 [Ensifer adhaerens]|uniref:hypothetical protein n=1 Tax=Ensifer adhaerens TaxID=106592 RepID=UPI003D069B97